WEKPMSTLAELDQQLAQRYGGFARYTHTVEPALVETYGDRPADEIDRQLVKFAQPSICMCGTIRQLKACA
ncbi:MAG TPA: hypothetical protein VFO07_12075, partial [Roseiflexaceae bacterium]|nr:hypothetical protein [Roseiflexaceae bacterium]